MGAAEARPFVDYGAKVGVRPVGDEIHCALVVFGRHVAGWRGRIPIWHPVASRCLLLRAGNQCVAPIEFVQGGVDVSRVRVLQELMSHKRFRPNSAGEST